MHRKAFILTLLTRLFFVAVLVSLSLFIVFTHNTVTKELEIERIEREKRQNQIMNSALDELVEVFSASDDEIYIPSCSPIYYEIRTGNVEFKYTNPKDNSCFLRISITRKDTSETIYASNLISPSTEIGAVSFTPKFRHPGYYDCMIKVDVFSADRFSFMGSVVMETYVCTY